MIYYYNINFRIDINILRYVAGNKNMIFFKLQNSVQSSGVTLGLGGDGTLKFISHS